MTGRRFCDDKSVNGTGTRTMSPWAGIVPVLVVGRVIPEAEATGGRGRQVGRLVAPLDHEHRDAGVRRQGRRDGDPPGLVHLALELPRGLCGGHGRSLGAMSSWQIGPAWASRPPAAGRDRLSFPTATVPRPPACPSPT